MTDAGADGIKWEAPPDRTVNGGKRPAAKWVAIAAELRSRPGHWALVAEDVAPSTQTSIRWARLVAFRPAGAFEATSRKRPDYDDQRVDVYARYVGEAGEHA